MAENYRRLCTGLAAIEKPPELHYADYVAWHNQHWAKQDRAQQVEGWNKRLQPFSGLLELPLSFPRPRYQTFQGRSQNFTFGKEASSLLRTFSTQRGSSLFLTLLACFMVVCQRYTRQSDIIIGTPFSDRNQHKQLEHVMGCFINTLPLAANIDHDTTFNV